MKTFDDLESKLESLLEIAFHAKEEAIEVEENQLSKQVISTICDKNSTYYYMDGANIAESLIEDYDEDFNQKLADALIVDDHPLVSELIKDKSYDYWFKYVKALFDDREPSLF